MRICGNKGGLQELRGPEKRPQPYRMAREGVDSTLLAVDDADGRPALKTLLAQGLDGADGGTARGDDVLDEADQRARFEAALEPVPRAVLLRFLAHDHEGKAGGERGRGGARDGSEL